MALSFSKFSDLLDLHGSRFERWPREYRDAAQALVNRSPEALQAYHEALILDDALDDCEIEIATATLTRLGEAIGAAVTYSVQARPMAEQYVSRSTAKRRWWSAGWFTEFAWPQATALAAVASIGIIIGWSAPTADTSGADVSLVSSVLVQDGPILSSAQ